MHLPIKIPISHLNFLSLVSRSHLGLASYHYSRQQSHISHYCTTRRAMSSTSRPPSPSSSVSQPLSAPKITFPPSPIPPNPLGEGKYIRTAAALIIGDEILNGKTHDRNSHVFAQYCFEHGVDLKRIEVIADNEEEIIEASRRLVSKYDFVVTSGGIGPTHDDITYECLAKAFNQGLTHHQETIHRMSEMSKQRHKWIATQTPDQRAATYRMALFPDQAEVIYVAEDVWVPVVRLAGKLCVFPGIPALFHKMLYSLTDFIPLPPKHERPQRIQIFTERPESLIAPYLTSLQERLKPHGIQVGSYPVLYKGVFVSLIGRDLPTGGGKPGVEKIWLVDIAQEVEREIGGKIASEEEIAQRKETRTPELVAAKQLADAGDTKTYQALEQQEKAKF